eukprot:CAMPEP_0194696498 /NCGR_PEP_ID=MMETSP0295-20121207/22723_1 /TAXON_ID=39354 /ORGANISM="Heterosigma akashiwo, Strain CCMP2393" /LENGTH=55 /DNA_ID=CAMNT_0039588703 /DNA_START=264 /DNA_END=428 /DNA_ORIENTATION=+
MPLGRDIVFDPPNEDTSPMTQSHRNKSAPHIAWRNDENIASATFAPPSNNTLEEC